MALMQTRFDCFAPAIDWLNPMGSWDAAARWNAMAYEWMTRGWQQWLQLATIWPSLENPAAAANEIARSVDALDVPATVIAPSASAAHGSAAAAPASRSSASRPQAGTQKARNASTLKAMSSRRRGNDKSEVRPRAADTKKAKRRPAKQKARG